MRLPTSWILLRLPLRRRVANVRVHSWLRQWIETNRRKPLSHHGRTTFTSNIMLGIHSRLVDLEGVPTEIMVQAFADRVLILVTQMGKVGNLVHLQHFAYDSITDL